MVDVFLSKFDAGGNFQWVRTWGGQGTEDATGIVAVDGANNVYVAGRFASINCDFNPGGTPDLHSTAGGLDSFLSKFDANGNFQWARTWGGTGADQANGLAVDGAGRVYVAGSFQGTVDFDPGSGTDSRTSNGKSDAWLSQFDANGNFQWAQTWGGNDDDSSGVNVDRAGDVYASGWFAGTGAGGLGPEQRRGQPHFQRRQRCLPDQIPHGQPGPHGGHAGLRLAQCGDRQDHHPPGPGGGRRRRSQPNLHLDDRDRSRRGQAELQCQWHQRRQEHHGHLRPGRQLRVPGHHHGRWRTERHQPSECHRQPDTDRRRPDALHRIVRDRDVAGRDDPSSSPPGHGTSSARS